MPWYYFAPAALIAIILIIVGYRAIFKPMYDRRRIHSSPESDEIVEIAETAVPVPPTVSAEIIAPVEGIVVTRKPWRGRTLCPGRGGDDDRMPVSLNFHEVPAQRPPLRRCSPKNANDSGHNPESGIAQIASVTISVSGTAASSASCIYIHSVGSSRSSGGTFDEPTEQVKSERRRSVESDKDMKYIASPDNVTSTEIFIYGPIRRGSGSASEPERRQPEESSGRSVFEDSKS